MQIINMWVSAILHDSFWKQPVSKSMLVSYKSASQCLQVTSLQVKTCKLQVSYLHTQNSKLWTKDISSTWSNVQTM